jgi:hypothetical protein
MNLNLKEMITKRRNKKLEISADRYNTTTTNKITGTRSKKKENSYTIPHATYDGPPSH